VKARVKFIIGATIIVVTLAWLGWLGATESKTYYHTVSELATLKGPALHQRMRVSGYVEDGSIRRGADSVAFVIQEDGKPLKVNYVGTDPLPDTFKGGAQALVQGRLQPDGSFRAEQVQAKCASKYAPAPGPAQSSSNAQPQSQGAATGTAH
jgi:cytochrome c-type biogenesis protein CcmE